MILNAEFCLEFELNHFNSKFFSQKFDLKFHKIPIWPLCGKCCRVKIIIIIIIFFSIRIFILYYRWLEKMSSWSKFQSCFSLIFVHLIKIIFVNVTWNSNNNWIFHVCWKLSSFKLKLLFRNKNYFRCWTTTGLNCLISIVTEAVHLEF